MGRALWSAKWFLERESSPAFSLEEVAAGSYRHIHINSKLVYRRRGPQSLAGDYLRSFGETMSKAIYPLKLPLSIKKAAQRLAKEDGVSLNQWIAAAVAEKVGVVETAADFFKKRAGKAAGEGLMKSLHTAPKLAAEPEDTL